MFGQRLKELREEKNLKQTDISEKLNITQTSYSYYEKEKRSPDYATLKKLADFFGVSMCYILGETDVRAIPIASNIETEPSEPTTAPTKNQAAFDELDEEGQMKVLEYMELLRQKHGKK